MMGQSGDNIGSYCAAQSVINEETVEAANSYKRAKFYQRYGIEWEKEMMKKSKSNLINMLREEYIKNCV